MELAKKTLYNLLRLHFLQDEAIEVEPWQVVDYRLLNFSELFQRLNQLYIQLDKTSFIIYTENYDSPEELSEDLLCDVEDTSTYDQAYLLLFELWRRCVPLKRCVSIFCDEIDYRIELYDKGHIHAEESIEDILSHLQLVLNESRESGDDPAKVLELIYAQCANDLESFLYDFLSQQLDKQAYAYVAEMLSAFSPYVSDQKWFAFLHARLSLQEEAHKTTHILTELFNQPYAEDSFALYLEILHFLAQHTDHALFILGITKILPLLYEEQEFCELLHICIAYCDYAEREAQKQTLQNMLEHHARRKAPLSPAQLEEEKNNLQESFY